MFRISKKKLLIFFLAAAGYFPSRAQSESGNRWSLQRSIDHALANNLQVKLSALNAEVSRISLQEANASALPSLNGNGSQNFNSGRSVDPFTNTFVTQNIWSNNFSLNANVTLFSGFQLKNSRVQARLNQEASEADLLKAKNDMVLNLMLAYMQVLFNDELLATAKLNLSTSQAQAQRTEKLYKVGNVAEASLLEINAQVAGDELNVINAQNNKDIAELNLMQLLDLQDKRNFEVEKPDLPDPAQSVIDFNAESVFETAQQSQPEIKAASLRIRSAISGIDIARANYYPRLSLSGFISSGYSSARQLTTITGTQQVPIGYIPGPNGEQIPILSTQPSYVSGTYAFTDQFSDNISQAVSLNLSVPIFNKFQARYGVHRAKISRQTAELNLQQERNTLRQKIEQAYADVIAAQKRYVAAKTQLDSWEKAYKNAGIRFNSGILNTTDFNVSKNNFTRAQSDLIQAKYDYTFKLKILDFYQGKPLTF